MADRTAPGRAPFIHVGAEPLDATSVAASVRDPECGALVVFEGLVRADVAGKGRVAALTYEMYEEMALRELERIARHVMARWPEARLGLAHRTGRLTVGETSVIVACAAPHRREAFAAARLAMDSVKETLPVWKVAVDTG